MTDFHLLSLGCAKNRVDSEVVVADLLGRGFNPVDRPEEAEVIIINTCAFIRPAVDEAVDNLLAAVELKAEGRVKWVVGLGCLPQRYQRELVTAMPEVDLFIPISSLDQTGRAVTELISGRSKTDWVEPGDMFLLTADTPRALTTEPGAAYVKLAEGCPNRCAYCTIPDIRGRQVSRRPADILAELSRLARSGISEATLIAQDLTAYGDDLGRSGAEAKASLTGLLRAIDELDDCPAWIRLLYLNPGRVDDALLAAIAESSRVLPYLDLPLQHAQPRVIARMGRRPPGDDLLTWLDHIRAAVPEAVIRTTLMLGFPGETEADFEACLEFVARAEIDHLGAFAFCPEEGTRAAAMPDQVPAEIAQARQEAIMAAQLEVSRRLNQNRVGQRVDVLVTGPHPDSDLILAGRAWFQAPEVDGGVIITDGQGREGEIQPALITEAHDYDLVAELAAD